MARTVAVNEVVVVVVVVINMIRNPHEKIIYPSLFFPEINCLYKTNNVLP